MRIGREHADRRADALTCPSTFFSPRLFLTSLSSTSGEGVEVKNDFFELRTRKVDTFEREYLVELLKRVKGDVSRASEAASLPRATFYRLLKKHKIEPADFR